MSVDPNSTKDNDLLDEGCPEYDPRCANCDHYPWTGVFKSYITSYSYGKDGSTVECKCECHNVLTVKKLMRFSLKQKQGVSKHVIHVEKLAVCPFCKRSEFEDSVFHFLDRHGLGILLEEDLKATGAPKREYGFDYNDYPVTRGGNGGSMYLAYCAGSHRHEWYECKCGRNICKVSFRNYFGYEIGEDLSNRNLVDESHYSKRTRDLLGLDERYDHKPADEVPVYATMETIEKVWGKLPMFRGYEWTCIQKGK